MEPIQIVCGEKQRLICKTYILAASVFQTWWSLMLLKKKILGEWFLACGKFKSKVCPIWYAQGFEGMTILTPQGNCQECGVGLTNCSIINKGDTDISQMVNFLLL